MAKGEFTNESTYKKFLEDGKEAEFDRLFDEAVVRARAGFGKSFPLYIDGEKVYASEQIVERSPIDGTVIGTFQKATREHAKAAINAALKAFDSWAKTDYKQRAAVFQKAADLFSANKFDLAAALSCENGKSRYESVGEVDEAIDFMHYYANELLVNRGFVRRTKITASTAKVNAGFQGAPGSAENVTITMRPYGVFGVIAPFNFPVSISVGMSVGAMITGNTVVFKPSSTDSMSMLTGLKIYELLKEGGVPPGVFNYVTGPGSEVGDELVANKDVAGIAFTGSRSVGMGMIAKTYGNRMQKVFVVEMGGKNPAIVSRYANLDDAATGVVSAAFGFAGQKCSALSRVYVHESVKELFVSKLIEKVHTLKIGNPLEKGVYVGPLIAESAYKRYAESIEKAKASGNLLHGGNRANTGMNGFYVEPAIVELRQDHELVHKELFVPILCLITYKDIDEAISMANDVEYGLTAGLYSSKRSEIKAFTERIQAGVVYVNRAVSATTGAMVGLHTFVGWKDSGLTGKGTGSKFYLPQFMREQSISVTK